MNALLLAACLLGQTDYPVGFLAVERDFNVAFQPQSFNATGGVGPYVVWPGTNLYIIEPDGTERMLVQGQQGAFIAVHDWCVSLDGQSVYYSHVFDHEGRRYADIFRVPVAGGAPVRLTNAIAEWRPPTGVYPAGSQGSVWNTAPCDTPEGIVFTSTRDDTLAPSADPRNLMLYRMDHDGSNVEKIGHMNLGGVLHPSYFKGRVYFSTNETQGLRGGAGNGWAIWSIKPDGTDWQPEFTQAAGTVDDGWHITTHTSDGTLVADEYYDTQAFGKLLAAPPLPATPFAGSKFGHPLAALNPLTWSGWDSISGTIAQGNIANYPFQRVGAFNPLPMFHREDRLNTDSRDPPYYQRTVGHPCGGPGNSLLVTWTGEEPGDKSLGRALGIYVIANIADHHHHPPQTKSTQITDLSDRPLDYFTKVVDLVDRHEWYGRAVVSYEAIYGSPAPAMTPSPKATELPDGTPYGIIGSSNINWNEILNDDGKSLVQINPADVAGIRILHFNPTQAIQSHPRIKSLGSGYNGFASAMNERTGYYEQLIPVESDGSFKAAVPADQPWTFQLIDHDGYSLATAQTWHQVRPGEVRTDCNGCHAHHQPAPEKFADQIAGQPGYSFVKLDKIKTLVYERDIKEIDERVGLGIGPAPWTSNAAWKTYKSRTNVVLRDSRLTEAERRILAAWQDTGCMAEAGADEASQLGPYADAVPPTLTLKAYTDKTLVGAADPHAGINWGSLSVIHNGNDIASLFTRNGDVLTGPAVDGTVTISIRDNQHGAGAEQGNLTQLVRKVTPSEPPVEPPPPNPNQPRIDEINARLAEIAEEIEDLEAERAALESELETLENP